jgi:hypothetical protein
VGGEPLESVFDEEFELELFDKGGLTAALKASSEK